MIKALVLVICLALAHASESEFDRQMDKLENSKFGRTLLQTIFMQIQTEDPVANLIAMMQNLEAQIDAEQRRDDDRYERVQAQCSAVTPTPLSPPLGPGATEERPRPGHHHLHDPQDRTRPAQPAEDCRRRQPQPQEQGNRTPSSSPYLPRTNSSRSWPSRPRGGRPRTSTSKKSSTTSSPPSTESTPSRPTSTTTSTNSRRTGSSSKKTNPKSSFKYIISIDKL